MLAHLIVGLALVVAGLAVILLRGTIAGALQRGRRPSGVLTNPLYVGPAVMMVGLIFAVSALVGVYG